jgi:hypothetical protein
MKEMKKIHGKILRGLWKNIRGRKENQRALTEIGKYLRFDSWFLYLLYTEFGGNFDSGFITGLFTPPLNRLLRQQESGEVELLGEVEEDGVIRLRVTIYDYSAKTTLYQTETRYEIIYENPWVVTEMWRRDNMEIYKWKKRERSTTKKP